MGGVEAVPARRPVGLFIVALVAVMAAIIFMGLLSRRSASHAAAAAPMAVADPPAAPIAAPVAQAAEPPAAGVPAAAPAAAASAEDAAARISTQQQFQITRVVRDGRPGIEACYQRALVRDATLVHGNLNVRVSIAPSGRVEHVAITGPASFRVLKPCLHAAVSRWIFPTASAPYETQFPLQLRGGQ